MENRASDDCHVRLMRMAKVLIDVQVAAGDLFVALADYGNGDDSFRRVLDCADDLKAAMTTDARPAPGGVQ